MEIMEGMQKDVGRHFDLGHFGLVSCLVIKSLGPIKENFHSEVEHTSKISSFPLSKEMFIHCWGYLLSLVVFSPCGPCVLGEVWEFDFLSKSGKGVIILFS